MHEIEFLDPAADPPAAPAPRTSARPSTRVRGVIVRGGPDVLRWTQPALWAAAAALALAASFQRISEIRLPRSIGGQRVVADGWGREPRTDRVAGVHGPRSGVVLVVAAALLVAAATLAVLALRHAHRAGTARRAARAAGAAGVAATAVAATLLVSALLDASSSIDSIRAELRGVRGSFAERVQGTATLHLGPYVWVLAAAVACAVAADVLALRTVRDEDGPPAGTGPPLLFGTPSPPVAHPDDEALSE